MSLTEKFQITVPTREEAGEPWVSFESQRRVRVPQEKTGKFNQMPEIDEQDLGSDGWVYGVGGNTDVSDGVNDHVLNRGFHRHQMKGTDDQYGGEHVDLFYGEVEDEKGNVGFAERNNYLDRM